MLKDVYMLPLTCVVFVVMTLMTIVVYRNRTIKKAQKIRFYMTFWTIVFVSLCEFISVTIQGTDPSLMPLSYMMMALGYGFAPFIPIILVSIVYNGKQKRLPFYFYLVYLVSMIFLVSFNQVFTFDDNFMPVRQWGFYYFVAFYILMCIYSFVSTYLMAKKFLSRNTFIFYFIVIAFFLGTGVQLVWHEIHITWIVASILIIIFYAYVSELWNQLDGLTGLFSQFTFLYSVDGMKYGEALFVMDIDNFKQLNDTYGHIEGDKYLHLIAKMMQDIFGKHGTCFRLGGDEFVAIVKKDADFEQLLKDFKERNKIECDSDSVYPNVSIGYAVYEEGMYLKDFESLADRKMYIDKNHNKSFPLN